jgi:crotonobetainyl-CoA:carnitine CoA-transferase CaiB-like acyl-CoA transferase
MSIDSPSAILDDLLRRAGLPADQPVTFTGADPVLPTPFRIGDLGAASIAAAAAQAARLLAQRTEMAQTVHVDVDAAAAAMRSSRYLTSAPPLPSPTRRPVGFYRTGDGRYVFLQRLFAHHHVRQLTVLGLPTDASDEAITQRALDWDGAALEEAVVEAGACGALVRTAGEWARHEQGRALAEMPLFSITKIGDSEPEPAGSGDLRPLCGTRVLDLTRVLAGPMCARTLAEHGAQVLRVGTAAVPDDEQMMRDSGHGKRSTELDLKSAPDVGILRRLVRGADVFSQGYRPGALDRLGFSPAELAELRPGIISVSLSAYGRTGPWSTRRGFDSVVQSASGIAAELSGANGVPRALPANPLDYTTGYLAAFLVMVALERRAREGGSYHIDLSLAQTGRYLTGLSRADPALVAQREPDIARRRLDELMITRRTPFGLLRYLAPVARLSGTPPRWNLPSVPLNNDRPDWTWSPLVTGPGAPTPPSAA